LVNGDFQINEGKFKLPLLNGSVNKSVNKFKDIEIKYMRNVDEWLANLYIQIRKIDLVDFKLFKEKIEFKIPSTKEEEPVGESTDSDSSSDKEPV